MKIMLYQNLETLYLITKEKSKLNKLHKKI